MEIFLPRLAERDKDILALARHFGDRAARREKRKFYFSAGVIQVSLSIRGRAMRGELEPSIKYTIPRCNSTVLLSDLP